MEPILQQGLPDDVLGFRGTAAELAEKCNELLPTIGLAEEAGTANERLIRHYVQVEVLTAPDREGREALFGARQVAEFLTARHLLKDGWTLSKIAELIKSTGPATGPEGLMSGVPGERSPTAAEQVLARLRSPPAPSMAVREAAAGTYSSAPSSGRSFPSSEPLLQASEISRRRLDLQTNLKALGNPSGATERRRTVRIRLAPWCDVYLDARELQRMPAETPEILGNALTQALQEERIRKGEKS